MNENNFKIKEPTLIKFTSYLLTDPLIITKLNDKSYDNTWACSAYIRNLFLGKFSMPYLFKYWINSLRYFLFKVARVTVAHQLSLVTLIQGTDSLCYNYSLPYTFNSVA